MNALILEDNQICRESLVKVVKSCMKNITVYDFDNRSEAYLCAMDNNIDLFLVDIILEPKVRNDSSGFKFAQDIRDVERYKAVPIIVVTSLAGLAEPLLKVLHCFDYIEKPVDYTIVRRHVVAALETLVSDKRVKEPETILLRYEGITFPIVIDNVRYVVSRRSVLNIHTTEEVIEIPNLSTKAFLERIRDNVFLEPLKGTIVNKKYIRSVDFPGNKVYLHGTDDVIDIGGRLKKQFREDFERCFGQTN